MAEVTNTPWGERHVYVVRAGPGGRGGGARQALPRLALLRHGPALPLDASTCPARRLTVEMRNEEGGREVFRRRPGAAAPALERRARSGGPRSAQPLMTWKVHAAIYWQALRLWVKGTPSTPTRPSARPRPPGGRRDQPLQPPWRSTPGRAASPFRRAVLARLGRLERGTLTVEEGGERLPLGRPAADGLAAHLRCVRRPGFWRRVAAGRLAGRRRGLRRRRLGDRRPHRGGAAPRPQPGGAGSGWSGGLALRPRPLELALRPPPPQHPGRRRRNIADHYDLGNDFFALMLDPTMTYSSGVFEPPERHAGGGAASASSTSSAAACGSAPADHLLEIGTGWGSLALHAAAPLRLPRHHHHPLAGAARAGRASASRAAGLADRITVLLRQDYRDLRRPLRQAGLLRDDRGHRRGAVPGPSSPAAPRCSPPAAVAGPPGHHHRRPALRPGAARGRLHQAPRLPRRAASPRSTALLGAATGASDLRLRQLQDYAPHYARTLAAWRDNLAARTAPRWSGSPSERFRRLWHFYLCYCEGGFAEGHIGVAQMTFSPGSAGLEA